MADTTIENLRILAKRGELKSELLIALVSTSSEHEEGLYPLDVVETIREFD